MKKSAIGLKADIERFHWVSEGGVRPRHELTGGRTQTMSIWFPVCCMTGGCTACMTMCLHGFTTVGFYDPHYCFFYCRHK